MTRNELKKKNEEYEKALGEVSAVICEMLDNNDNGNAYYEKLEGIILSLLGDGKTVIGQSSAP